MKSPLQKKKRPIRHFCTMRHRRPRKGKAPTDDTKGPFLALHSCVAFFACLPSFLSAPGHALVSFSCMAVCVFYAPFIVLHAQRGRAKKQKKTQKKVSTTRKKNKEGQGRLKAAESESTIWTKRRMNEWSATKAEGALFHFLWGPCMPHLLFLFSACPDVSVFCISIFVVFILFYFFILLSPLCVFGNDHYLTMILCKKQKNNNNK